MSTQLQPVPPAVKTASALWLTAVGAGVLESALAVAGMLAQGSASLGELAGGLGLRLAVFGAAIFLALRLRQGRGWARIALALTLGVFGTLSLVVGPVQWLLAGNSIVDFFAGADAMTLAFTFSRVLHVLAVLGAMSLMFSPVANAYFRRKPVKAVAAP